MFRFPAFIMPPSQPTPAPTVVVDEPKVSEVEKTEQAPVLAPAITTTAAEPVKDEVSRPLISEESAIAPADTLQVEKQPTTTHAESGTAHTDAEPATKVDGTTDKPVETAETAPAATSKTETAEEKKEEKKVAVKVSCAYTSKDRMSSSQRQEKTEKTKVEGKSFFAKIFGSKDKSPKKPKVKTPKASCASFESRRDDRS